MKGYAAGLGMAFLLSSTSALAANIVVDSTADSSQSGDSCTLRDAINSANGDMAVGGCMAGAGSDSITFDGSGDTITLGGTQLPTITDALTITGPVTIDAANSSRIFTNQSNLTLEQLTLTNGTVTADGGDADARSGGAILNDDGGVLTVSGGAMNNNTADRAGGAIEEASGASAGNTAVTLNNVDFSGNDAGMNPGNGGVLHVTGAGDIVVNGGTFDSNTAVEGGALWNNGGTLAVSGATFTGNTATGGDSDTPDQGGGAIFANTADGVLDISGSLFDSNAANGDVSSGGAIFVNEGAILMLADTTLTNNTANRAGGGIEFRDASSGTLDNLSASSNIANPTAGGGGGNGGVVHVTGSADVDITGGIYANNMAVEGGALWNNQGEMTLDGVSVVGNDATGDDATQGGGGIYGEAESSDGAGSGTLTISNSRIANNTASGDAGSGGGILVSPGAALNMTGGVIAGNSANRAGGGIENANGTVTLTRVTLGGTDDSAANDAGNNPGNGGALHIGGTGTATITRSSVGNNTATEGGGLWNNTASTMVVDTSTVSNNTADRGAGIYLNGDGSTVNLDYASITNNNGIGIESGTATSGGLVTIVGSSLVANNTTDDIGPNVTVDDLDNAVTGDVAVDDYQLFGGPTATQPLPQGSVALDTNADCGDSDDDTDQRGAERPFDAVGVDNGDGTCDSGAYELTDDPALTVTANGPDSVTVGRDDGQATVLGFTLANDSEESVTVGGFSGPIVRDAQLPPGIDLADLDLTVYEDDGNGTFEGSETQAGTGSIGDNGAQFTVDFDGGAGASIPANGSVSYVLVASIPDTSSSEQTSLTSQTPLLAGGMLLGLLGLFSVGGIRRRTQLLLIVAALALTLTACSDSDDNNVNLDGNDNNVPDVMTMGQVQFVLQTLDATNDTDTVIGAGLPVRGPIVTFEVDNDSTDSASN